MNLQCLEPLLSGIDTSRGIFPMLINMLERVWVEMIFTFYLEGCFLRILEAGSKLLVGPLYELSCVMV